MSAIIEPQSATWWVSDRWAYRSALTCMIRYRIPARSESERRQRAGFRTWFETFDTAAEAWQSLAEYETRLYRTELAVAECEKHGIDPERIAELSALGLDPQATIRGLTEGYPPARLAYPDSVR